MHELAQLLVKKDKRLVVVIVGQMRSAHETIPLLRQHLLDHCRHIILVQCPASESHMAADLYGTDFVDGWDPSSVPFAIKYAWPVFGNSGVAVRKEKLSFYFQLCRQFRVAKKFGSLLNAKTDMALKWRPDLFLFESIAVDESGFDQALHLPPCDNHGGYNDQCAIGNWAIMGRYLQRMTALRKYLESGGSLHPESFLKWSMRGQKIKRMRICCALNRGDGKFAGVKCSRIAGDIKDKVTLASFKKHGVAVCDQTNAVNTKDQSSLKFKRLAGVIWQRIVSLLFIQTK